MQTPVSHSLTVRMRSKRNSKIIENCFSGRSKRDSQQFLELPGLKANSEQCINMGVKTVHHNALLSILSDHFAVVEGFYRTILSACAKLQVKIAELQKNFNSIELTLTKKIQQMRNDSRIRLVSLKLNEQVQDKMQKLKQEYEQFKKQKYVSVLDKRLSQLQTAATNLMGQDNKHKQEMKMLNKQLTKLQHLKIPCQQLDVRLIEQVYSRTIVQLIRYFTGKGDVGQFVQKNILENMQLKAKLMRQTQLQSPY